MEFQKLNGSESNAMYALLFIMEENSSNENIL